MNFNFIKKSCKHNPYILDSKEDVLFKSIKKIAYDFAESQSQPTSNTSSNSSSNSFTQHTPNFSSVKWDNVKSIEEADNLYNKLRPMLSNKGTIIDLNQSYSNTKRRLAANTPTNNNSVASNNFTSNNNLVPTNNSNQENQIQSTKLDNQSQIPTVNNSFTNAPFKNNLTYLQDPLYNSAARFHNLGSETEERKYNNFLTFSPEQKKNLFITDKNEFHDLYNKPLSVIKNKINGITPSTSQKPIFTILNNAGSKQEAIRNLLSYSRNSSMGRFQRPLINKILEILQGSHSFSDLNNIQLPL